VLHSDWLGVGLYLGFLVALGLPAVLLKVYFNVPFELMRKIYHLVITMSIFPLMTLFSTWYMAILAAFMLVLIAYPLLVLVKNTAFYRRIAVERAGGEFKRSLLIVQVSIALLIFVFWGLLGPEWKYVAVVAVMAWGFGDAAAALVGKNFGRRPIVHPWIEGRKTMEGTQAMFATAGLAIFFTLLIYAGQPWPVSLAVALLAAPVCAVVELFSNRGMDTLTVPISTGLAVLPLMSIFSFLGI
jgi:phytol kinase